jgi:hypothetical protein
MFFKKKKDVDLRELQKRGLIRIPKKEVELETDRNGFIDMSTTTENSSQINKTPETESNFFNFMDNTSSSFSTSKQDSEEKREATRKFEEMDNKIYKLEQRIELLERKVGVGSSSGYSWQ